MHFVSTARPLRHCLKGYTASAVGKQNRNSGLLFYGSDCIANMVTNRLTTESINTQFLATTTSRRIPSRCRDGRAMKFF